MKKLLFTLIALSTFAFGQTTATHINLIAQSDSSQDYSLSKYWIPPVSVSDPTGVSCTTTNAITTYSTKLFKCISGTFQLISGSGGGGGATTSATYAVNFNQSTLAGAAALTATVPVVALPAGAMIVGTVLVSETAFAATSMTSLKVSLGDASGPNVWSRNTSFDLLQTVTNTAFLADGGFGATTTAADTLNLYFTAVGANLSTLSAGKFHVTILYMLAPGSVTTL